MAPLPSAKDGGVCAVGLQGRSLRVRLDGGVEKWEDGKYLVFPLVCLVGGVKKWKGGNVENSFVWLERKWEGWKM